MIAVTVKGLPDLPEELQVRLRCDIWNGIKDIQGIKVKLDDVAIYLPYDFCELGGNEMLAVEIVGVDPMALRVHAICNELTQAVCVAVCRFTESHVRGCKKICVNLIYSAGLATWDSVNGFFPQAGAPMTRALS